MLLEEKITTPTNCLDFSLDYEKQIKLLQGTINNISHEKSKLINQNMTACPECKGKMKKIGKAKSTFSDVLTDHEVIIQRTRCTSCKYEAPSTVRTFLNGNTMSGALARIQSELGSEHSFRDSEIIFSQFSTKDRSINNHNRIKLTTEKLGCTLKSINEEELKLLNIVESKELILNVDGGHVKSKEPENRSFEGLTSVICKPDSLVFNKQGTRNKLLNKSALCRTEWVIYNMLSLNLAHMEH